MIAQKNAHLFKLWIGYKNWHNIYVNKNYIFVPFILAPNGHPHHSQLEYNPHSILMKYEWSKANIFSDPTLRVSCGRHAAFMAMSDHEFNSATLPQRVTHQLEKWMTTKVKKFSRHIVSLKPRWVLKYNFEWVNAWFY